MPDLNRFTQQGGDIHFRRSPVKLAGVYAGVGSYSTSDQLTLPAEESLKRLTQNGNNFTRHIVTPYWKYSPRDDFDANNCAFAHGGGRWDFFKWDIQKFNAGYFSRLWGLIDAAARLGVVVQVVLFDRTGLDVSRADEVAQKTYRWDYSPWNKARNVNPVLEGGASGLPQFYRNEPTLRSIQEAYIRHVVSNTRSWNVFYEVMNEPMGGSVAERVAWADWAVGVISSASGGGQLIFYNDHNPASLPHGKDVEHWRGLGAGSNYKKLHGVILHGLPDAVRPADYKWHGEKIIQVSSDTVNDKQGRDRKDANQKWCEYAFRNGMVFQAHTNSAEAAAGIGLNQPTVIKPVDFDPIGGGGIDRGR